MANSTIKLNQIPNDPTLRDLLVLFKKEVFFDLNSHHIGTIQAFDPINQKATATINYKKTSFQRNSDGTYVPILKDYPIVLDAPVICLGGGAGNLTFPIAQGDECLLLFNDRDIDNWFAGNAGGAVATSRSHAFPDALILVGIRSLRNVLLDYDTERAALRYGSTKLAVGETKVLAENDLYTLGELLQELTSELQNLTTQLALLTVTGVTTGVGVSGVPANAAAITAIGAQIGVTAGKLSGLLE